MQYHVKGILKLVVRQVVNIELDEVVESQYKVDAMDIPVDRAIDELKEMYPDYEVDFLTSAHVRVTKAEVNS